MSNTNNNINNTERQDLIKSWADESQGDDTPVFTLTPLTNALTHSAPSPSSATNAWADRKAKADLAAAELEAARLAHLRAQQDALLLQFSAEAKAPSAGQQNSNSASSSSSQHHQHQQNKSNGHFGKGHEKGQHHQQRSTQQRANHGGQHTSREREFGVIRTVKSPFGFIRCLDRAEDLYFQLTELPESAVGMEVSFLVATVTRADETKTRAVGIQVLPPGSVVFEHRSAERLTGVCSRALPRARRDHFHANNSVRGFIDINSSTSSSGAAKRVPFDREAVGRLDVHEGDSVSFVLLTDKRTKDERAVDIELVALAGVRERGVVVRFIASGGYGFIKSVSSVAEVYFHLSALVLLPIDGHTTAPDETINVERLLHNGQPVEFELDGSGGKPSASRVRVLPRSTVIEFDRVLPLRFRGTVTRAGRGGGERGRHHHHHHHGGKGAAASSAVSRGQPMVSIDAVVGDAAESAADVAAVLGKSVTFGTSDLQDMRASALQDGDTVEFSLQVSKADGSPSRALDIVFLAPAPVPTEDGVVVSINDERGFAFFESTARDTHVYFRLSEVQGGATVRVGSCVRARVDELDNGKKVLAKDVVLLPDNSVALFVRDSGDVPLLGVVERVAKPYGVGSIAPAEGGAALPFAVSALAAKSDEDASLVTFSSGHAELIKGDVVEYVREKHARSGALRAAAVRIRTPKGAIVDELTHGRIDTLPSHKRREERGSLVVHDAAKTKLSFAGTQVLSTQRLAPGMEVSFVGAQRQGVSRASAQRATLSARRTVARRRRERRRRDQR
jgi:cold shock CspA family protein